MNLGFEFHPEADNDIAEIWDFMAADSPNDADRVTDDIINVISRLVEFPHQGHKRIDLTSRPVLFARV
jgi:plasmid stabilization system protein ParE